MGRARKAEYSEEKFGKLTILERSESYSKDKKWVCLCDCGNKTKITIQHIKARSLPSCECTTSTLRSQPQIKHGGCAGGKNSPEYQSYKAMINRCLNTNRKDYPNYGGRGISICDRWSDIVTGKQIGRAHV